MVYGFNEDKSKVDIDKMLKIVDIHSSIEVISANGKAGKRIDVTNLIPDGYSFIGVISFNTVSIDYDNKNLALLEFYPEIITSPLGEVYQNVFVTLRNLSSTPYTNVSVRVRILLVKNLFLEKTNNLFN